MPLNQERPRLLRLFSSVGILVFVSFDLLYKALVALKVREVGRTWRRCLKGPLD